MIYKRFGKRVVDLALASVGLVLTAPIMAVVSLAILFEDGPPVLFRHRRVGANGKTFECFKFRTMPVGTPNVPSAAAGALTLTRVGRVIRRFSLDELPQLANVLRGDMSMVGPRPAIAAQTALLELRDRSGVATLRPGLTGLAQVRSYDGMSDEAKAEHDCEYARTMSFRTDMGIVVRTLGYLRTPPPTY